MSEGTNTRPAPYVDLDAFTPASAIGEAVMSARPRRDRQTPTRIVVVGEFNSGKTSLVNALVGAPLLTPSFITHTAYPTVLGFAARHSLSAEIANRKRVPTAWDCLDGPSQENIRRLHVGAPLERLKSMRVIDTPGLGFGDEGGDRRALQVCRNADTVIWCTPAMQAWKASEERAWLTLPRRIRERGILAVTFEDAIGSDSDANRLLARLRSEAGQYFREIAMASGLHALTRAETGNGLGSRPCRNVIAARSAATLVVAELL